MPAQFAGRVAIVTGAAQGIGTGITRMLLADGAAVLAFDRDEPLLRETVAALVGELAGEPDGRVEAFAGDVTDKRSVEAAVAAAESRLGAVDFLVNNAGIWVIKPFLENDDEDFDRTISVNVRGTWLFMKAVAPGMVERKRGAIVNFASVAAFSYTTPLPPYAASKAAVVALTRDVGFELARHGVRVNAVAPGTIANPRRSNAHAPSEGMPLGSGKAEDIAAVVRFLLSDGARYIVGQCISVAGGADLSISKGWD